MLPVVALIGRPNVGKSTLFNAMTGTRDALVADLPGLTRDRQYGFARRTDVPCIVVDTGGLVENADVIENRRRHPRRAQAGREKAAPHSGCADQQDESQTPPSRRKGQRAEGEGQ